MQLWRITSTDDQGVFTIHESRMYWGEAQKLFQRLEKIVHAPMRLYRKGTDGSWIQEDYYLPAQ